MSDDKTMDGGSTSERRSWMVANTQPNKEALALRHIENQSFLGYCPMIRRTVRHARQSRIVLRPLFPGYIFIARDNSRQQWRSLLSTIGVRSLIRVGDQPSLLDDAFVEGLKSREEGGAITKPTSPYQIGDAVRIFSGPFDGLIGEILELGDQDRITVMLNFLNRSVKTQVSLGSIKPLDI